MNLHQFSTQEIEGVYRAIRERRDIRHFQSKPIEPEQLIRFIEAAHRGPSVGYMQPWRFIRIVNPELRKCIHRHVHEERTLTADVLGERADEFMRLKAEGILACAEVLVVGLMDKRDSEFLAGGTRRRNWRGLGVDVRSNPYTHAVQYA